MSNRFKKNFKRKKGAVSMSNPSKKPQIKVDTKKLGYQMARQEANYGRLTKTNNIGEVFPESLRTSLIAMVNTQTIFPSGSAPTAGQLVYKGNSIKEIGPSVVSPLSAGIASFSIQYPTYLENLLGVNNTNGSIGIYNRYIVLGSKIRVRVISEPVENNNYSVIVFPTKDGQYQFGMSLSHVGELPYSKSKLLPNNLTTQAPVIYNSLTTKEFLGSGFVNQTSSQFTDTYLTASAPAQPWFWNVRIGSMSATDSTDLNVNVEVRIEYDVIFFSRNAPATGGPTQ